MEIHFELTQKRKGRQILIQDNLKEALDEFRNNHLDTLCETLNDPKTVVVQSLGIMQKD